MQLTDSELIINPDGSIYHLNLKPDQIAETIFLVGDPDRVPRVSKYFDSVEYEVRKREFVTHTGILDGKRLSVISTGISTDNIDIVINELDALVNIDLNNREPKTEHTSLTIIRIGTSGSIQYDIPVDSFVVSEFGMGLDNLLHFYQFENSNEESEILEKFNSIDPFKINPYIFKCDESLLKKIGSDMTPGITLTCPGFYAPQGRQLRAKSLFDSKFLDKIGDADFNGRRITNLEMETSAIYGLSKILGHKALSCNAILANRISKKFSQDPKNTVNKLIINILDKISDL